MSLVVSFPKEVPADTRRLAEPKLDPDSICRLLGEMAHEIIDEDELAEMYPQRGRGAINPVVLCIVTILQYCEDLPDRAAAKMAVMRLDWMFAARQPPDWQGFDFSSLCNFRKRLRKHGKERVIFDRVVNFLRERGYLKAGRQRLDSTHMLGDVERKSRLEMVWDSLRSALLAVMAAHAQWASQRLPASFVAEHSQERSDYRLNKAQIRQAMISAGQDGFWLLSQLAGTPLAGLEEVALLARVLEEQFARSDADDDVDDDVDADGDAEAGITPKANVDASGDVIATPHDPDARFSRKRGTQWLGHKTQVTETVDGDFRIISDIDIHSAIESDGQALAAIFERLKERGLLPETLFVDQGYCHGETLKDSEQKGVDLRGPVGDDTRKPPGFRLQDFDIDLDKQRAICPAGRFSVSFNPSKQDDVGWHARFGPQCNACLFRSLCTTAKRGRSLQVSPYHEYLAKRRLEQARPEFQEEMKQRILIESTIGELTRKHGLRRSRYRGQEKARLQAAFTAAAVNLKRLARHLAEAPRFFALPNLAAHCI